jgi:SSS family solute:Na+ symporter
MAGTTGFQSATYPLQVDGLTIPGYAALYALALNFALCLVLSPIFNRMAATMGTDETAPTDYRLGLRSGG